MSGYLNSDIVGALEMNPGAGRTALGLGLITGSTPLPGATFRRAFAGNAPAGNSDLYMAPVGKRAIIIDIHAYNANAGAVTVVAKPQIKISGAYYQLNVSASILQGGSAGFFAAPIVLEPGESISMNFDNSGTNIWARVIEYDATIPLYSPRIKSFVNGNNLLYRCPDKKTATTLGATGFSVANSSNSIEYMNGSVAPVTRGIFAVSAGDTPGTSNRLVANSLVASGAASHTSFRAGTLEAGDSLYVSTTSNAAGQFAWCNVIELPA